MASVARDEEAWWERELSRALPGLVLPGKPVRGGGRANSTQLGEAVVAIELERLRAMHPALLRRVLRAAAVQVGGVLSFDQTEALVDLARSGERATGKRGRVELGAGLVAERTPRELRLEQRVVPPKVLPERVVPVPGTVDAPEYGYRIRVKGELPAGTALLLRNPLPGDQVQLPHSRSTKTVKEVLERRGAAASERAVWPVLAVGNQIVWMRGTALEGMPGLQLIVEPLREAEPGPVREIAPHAT
jgi:tRNA(Ile)-lysidine synthase